MLQRFPNPTQSPGTAPPRAQGVPAAAGAPRGTLVPMLEVSIQRLEEIVEQETSALRARQVIDLKEFNDRKSQALLELMRWLRNIQGLESNPALAERIASLKSKLAVNQALLQVHLEAVREISTTLADAIRNAESDGTYTQAISSAAKRP